MKNFINNLVKKATPESNFWKWFISRSNEFYISIESNTENLFKELDTELHKYDQNLTYEFSQIKNNGKREFVISADGLTESINSVIKLVNAAPKMSNWEIKAFRQRKSFEQDIVIENFKVSPKDIYFSSSISNNKISITLYVSNFVTKKEYIGALFALIDNLIGEYDAMKYISSLDIKTLQNEYELKPITELPKLIDDFKKTENNDN